MKKKIRLKNADALVTTTGRSALWQIIGGGWQTIVRLGASVFLARALTPRDFGLFGMAMIAQEFISYMGALGVNAGVIAKKDVADDDVYTCFWIVAGMRFIMFLMGFFGAPLIAIVFNEPQLVSIARAVSGVFLISIVRAIPETLLDKGARFATLNIIFGISTILESILALGLAVWARAGLWSLVAAMYVGAVFQGVTIVIVAGWTPKLRFSRQSFNYLYKFGVHGLGFSITNYLSQNLDYLLVGRILGAQALGLYEFSYRMPHLVLDRIARPVGVVIFPALSRVNENDELLAAGYLKTVKFVCLLTFPFLAGLAAVADVAVPLVWGDKWIPIIVPLQILCLCAALRCPTQPTGPIFYCKQRPDLPFKIAASTLAFTAIFVAFLGYWFGVTGVALGMLLSVVPSYSSVFFVMKLTATPLSRFVITLLPMGMCSLVCATVALVTKKLFLFAGVNYPCALTSAILSGMIVYPLAILFLFPGLACEIVDVLESVVGRALPWLQFVARSGKKITKQGVQ